MVKDSFWKSKSGKYLEWIDIWDPIDCKTPRPQGKGLHPKLST